MNWNIVKATVIGTSHLLRGEPCQDYCVADTHVGLDEDEYLVVLVADGAGSANSGGEGSAQACKYGQSIIADWLNSNNGLTINENIVRCWIQSIQQRLGSFSEELGLKPADIASTLLGAVVGTNIAVYFQIGDGGIIAGRDGYIELLFWTINEEYVNVTHFLTDEDAIDHLFIKIWTGSIMDVALFTDGLQRLCLVYKEHKVHGPFFQPMLSVLRRATVEECKILNNKLASLLSGDSVSTQTDDDKTLILATRRIIG